MNCWGLLSFTFYLVTFAIGLCVRLFVNSAQKMDFVRLFEIEVVELMLN